MARLKDRHLEPGRGRTYCVIAPYLRYWMADYRAPDGTKYSAYALSPDDAATWILDKAREVADK